MSEPTTENNNNDWQVLSADNKVKLKADEISRKGNSCILHQSAESAPQIYRKLFFSLIFMGSLLGLVLGPKTLG